VSYLGKALGKFHNSYVGKQNTQHVSPSGWRSPPLLSSPSCQAANIIPSFLPSLLLPCSSLVLAELPWSSRLRCLVVWNCLVGVFQTYTVRWWHSSCESWGLPRRQQCPKLFDLQNATRHSGPWTSTMAASCRNSWWPGWVAEVTESPQMVSIRCLSISCEI
jgi:hypothetical protein